MTFKELQMAELKPVESSMFSHMGYEPAAQALTVHFKNSAFLHTFKGVPMEVFESSNGVKSLGQWFNATIKGQYETSGPQAADEDATAPST